MLFFIKKCVFIIFIYFFDEVSNFLNNISQSETGDGETDGIFHNYTFILLE